MPDILEAEVRRFHWIGSSFQKLLLFFLEEIKSRASFLGNEAGYYLKFVLKVVDSVVQTELAKA